MKIVLNQVGKTDDQHLAAGIDNYFSRLKKLVNCELITFPDIKSTKNMPVKEQKMTFSHQLVQLLFIEQLYRALTIINGIPYHHA